MSVLDDTAASMANIGDAARTAASGLNEAASAARSATSAVGDAGKAAEGAATAFGNLGKAINDGQQWKAANEQIAGLGKAVDAAKTSIYDLIPGVREMFDAISAGTKDNPLSLYFNQIVNGFQAGTLSAQEMYDQLNQVILGMEKVGAQGATFMGAAIDELRRYKGELADIIKKIDEGKRRGKEAVEETKKGADSVGKVGKGKSAGGKLTSTSSRVEDNEELYRLIVARNGRS